MTLHPRDWSSIPEMTATVARTSFPKGNPYMKMRGFDYSVLSEWRSRLIAAGRESQLLDQMLAHFQDKGWLKARGKARTDSTHVIGAIRKMNRLECVGETLRHALNQLATVADEWLLTES
jgi:transposase